MKDYARLQEDPVPYILAEPNPKNILEWHYVVSGPENSPYFGGQYHGHLVFPPDYPFKPPAVYMITPNGRFKTQKRLCLSISDFHPDTWNPAWSVSTILVGLLSFMLEDTSTMGSMESSLREKRLWALDSPLFNLKNDAFREIFSSLSQDTFAKLTDAQKRRLKEDFIKRKVKLDVFPELLELSENGVNTGPVDGKAAGAAPGSTSGDCDRNNNMGVREGAAAVAGAGVDEANGNGWSMNILILGVILAGLVVNYVLKSSNFYD